jgi:hypothetical protein
MKITVSALPLGTQPISILASLRPPVNFTALEIRLTSTRRNKAWSACTTGSAWIFSDDIPLSCLRLKLTQVSCSAIPRRMRRRDAAFCSMPVYCYGKL